MTSTSELRSAKQVTNGHSCAASGDGRRRLRPGGLCQEHRQGKCEMGTDSQGTVLHCFLASTWVLLPLCYSTAVIHGWSVVSDRMSVLLNAFHNRRARHKTRRFIRKDMTTGEWITQSRTSTLEEANTSGSAGLDSWKDTQKTPKHTGNAPNLPWQREFSQHS